MKLIIAEKKDMAQKIADSIGKFTPEDGYYDVLDCHVTWTWGHLFGLKEPNEYENQGWDKKWADSSIDDLPMIPNKYQYKLTGNKDQFKKIEDLIKSNKYDEIINSCDAEREGELIFRLLYNNLDIDESKTKVTRMWCNTTNKDGLLKALEERKDIKEYDGYYLEADSRSKADWLIGMNLSRLYMFKFFRKFVIGRVMTPTLCLIIERDLEIENFEESDIYNLVGEYNGFQFKRKFDTPEECDKFKDLKDFTVVDIVEEKKKKKAPKLFKLSTLQQQANIEYGYTLKQTLNILESLYLKGITSYPRSNMEYLPADLEESFSEILNNLYLAWFIEKDDIEGAKKCINDEKAQKDAHYAIIIVNTKTKEIDNLSKDERNIYDLISRRMIEATMKDFEYIEQDIQLNDEFSGKKRKSTQEGFNKIQYNKLQYNDNLDLNKGQNFQCDLEIKKTKTKPKPRFTDATIVSSMENLKDIDEKYKGGIGTPATRDSIIEKLVEYKYIERSKKTLTSTPIARLLYKLLSKQIKTVGLTAALEEKLEEVRLGNIEQETFLNFIEKYILNEIDRVKDLDDLRIEVCDCPFCGKKVLNQGLKYDCENEDCSFEIWKKNKYFESFGIKEKSITDDFVKQLCSSSGVMVKGLKSKKGEKYSAIFSVNEEDGKTNISVDFPKRKTKK